MKLKFSISNQLTKLCKLDLPRLTDANGENPHKVMKDVQVNKEEKKVAVKNE